MKYRSDRSFADTASAVSSMLLFVLFAVCMLLAVAVAADTYGRIKTGYQQSFGSAASIKYVTNKLRSAERITLMDNGGAAVESDGLVSLIWCEDGELYEKYSTVGEEITARDGDRISSADSLRITERDGLYEITVTAGEQTSTVLIRGGC